MSNAPWGGSEYLWSGAAAYLSVQGHRIFASVCRWRKPSSHLEKLRSDGVHITERHCDVSGLRSRLMRKLGREAVNYAEPLLLHMWLLKVKPDLVCISNGCFADNLRLVTVCRKMGIPYVLIAHANGEVMWPDDRFADEVMTAYGSAVRSFFVSRHNKDLLETQLGTRLRNAELVWNPVKVQRDEQLQWPSTDDGWRLACVARLHPKSKGQDLLLKVLARRQWQDRPVHVSFYGKGENEECLRREAQQLSVSGRLSFCGHVEDIDNIWATHHALVLPSRYEGLPISLVEALLCGRTAIVTDVGGNAEVLRDDMDGFVAASPTEAHLHEAMERAWSRRDEWQAMGQRAQHRLNTILPPQPAAAFGSRLLELVQQLNASPSRVASSFKAP
ncbi:glycosyltransferase family 4 protein [Azohydromonas australica]|uniref:glycosyltransferase family 4 protein n=1 Tax=Azohydromonas australica TaxID=364039 RepID=UPI00146F6692|nr:glycosyltransferase family 4 protein [Azohydromonas australica]